MKTKKIRRWFVILEGNEINEIISTSFPDAQFHSELSIKVGKNTLSKPAWEVEQNEIKSLLQYLLTSNLKIKPFVTVSIDGEIPQQAHRREYDDTYRRKENRSRTVTRKIKKQTFRTFK